MKFKPFSLIFIYLLLACDWGCVMTEEVKRIRAAKNCDNRYNDLKNGYLTGQQIFIRSCNTCHPGGKQSPLGPSILDYKNKFKTTNELKHFIVQGSKSGMPGQTNLTSEELENLVQYLSKEF